MPLEPAPAPLRFSPVGQLVDAQGEIIDPADISTDQIADLRARLTELGRSVNSVKHTFDNELVRRIDDAIDRGDAPEQYTIETDRYKVSVTSRRAARRTDETALRTSLLAHADELSVPPARIERLFTAAGWKRNQNFWQQFAAEVPAAAAIFDDHTVPTFRAVTKIERLAHARTPTERPFVEVKA